MSVVLAEEERTTSLPEDSEQEYNCYLIVSSYICFVGVTIGQTDAADTTEPILTDTTGTFTFTPTMANEGHIITCTSTQLRVDDVTLLYPTNSSSQQLEVLSKYRGYTGLVPSVLASLHAHCSDYPSLISLQHPSLSPQHPSL